MKKSFICSLICHNGILGGGLYIDDSSVTYKTNKLTVDRKYKNLAIAVDEICELSWSWIVFPIATLRLTSGEQYKLIIFNKKGFDECYNQIKRGL